MACPPPFAYLMRISLFNCMNLALLLENSDTPIAGYALHLGPKAFDYYM